MDLDGAFRALARARSLIELGRAGAAVPIAADVVAAFPEDGEARAVLGHALLLDERPREALEAAEAAAGLDPEAEWPHRLRAYALIALRRPKDAHAAAREAVRLEPQLAVAHLSCARAALGARRWDEARAAASRTLELDPANADAHVVLGDVAHAAKEYDEALAHYDRGLAIEPEHDVLHNNRGRTFQAMGKEVWAEASYRRAARLDPEDEIPRGNLVRNARVNLWTEPVVRCVVFSVFVAVVARLSSATVVEILIAVAAIFVVGVPIGLLFEFDKLTEDEQRLLRNHGLVTSRRRRISLRR